MVGAALAVDHGWRRWYAALAGIVWWFVHLNALAALAHLTCDDPGVRWIMHGITLVTLAGTALAMWWAYGLVRQTADSADDEVTAASNGRFLGLFGLLVNGASVVLIVAEGLVIVPLTGCS